MSTETLDYNNGVDELSKPQSIVKIMQKGMNVLFTWHIRQKGRIELSELDDRILEDIGMTREQMEKEIDKPFWVK